MRGRVWRRRWVSLALLFGLSVICSAQSGNSREQEYASARGTTLWNQIKTALTAYGQRYFENLRGSSIPPRSQPEMLFVGTIAALDSNEQPTLLLLSMADSEAPEISLRITYGLKHPKLNQSLAVGMKIAFEGVVMGFTAYPFMLYLDARRLSLYPKIDIIEGDLL
jgi:hypothetical protein